MGFVGETGEEIRDDLIEGAGFGVEEREEVLGFLDSDHGGEGKNGRREGEKESFLISSPPSGGGRSRTSRRLGEAESPAIL